MCATAARSWAMKRYDRSSRACRSRRRFRSGARIDTAGRETVPAGTVSFAVVVLPQPDSPTRPSVLPGSMVNEMSSTARTTAVARAKSPRRTGKCLVRFFASRTGPAMLAGKPAAAGMSVGHAELGRCLRAAPVHDFRAARVERAAARERGGVWRLAVDRGEPRAAVAEARDGLEERPGVRMRRRVVDPRHGAGPDEAG